MHNRISSIASVSKQILRSKAVVATLLSLVVIVLAYAYFSSDKSDQTETLVVHPGQFVQQISVSGTVKAAQDVDLAFSQGGRINRVSVSVGNYVNEGQVLAELENGDIRAQVLQKEAALENAKAKLATLQAGSRPEEIAQAQAAVTQSQTALMNALNTAYTVADDAVHNKTDEIYSNPRTNPQINFSSSNSQALTNVAATRSSLESMFASWQKSLLGLSLINLSDVTATTQQNLTSVSQYLGAVNSLLNTALPNASVSQTTLNTYTTDAGVARSNVNSTIASAASAVSALDAANRTLTLKQAGTTQTDIDAQAAQVKAALADLANIQAQLQKTIIAAPFTGLVTKVDAKVGETAGANTALISLISAGTYEIESYIPEINVASVRVGNTAVVTLDAYGETVPFNAKVISIDPASQVRDGVSTYRALLQFINNDSRIRAGMTANVVITTDARSGVISVPQKIVQVDGETSHVYVREGNKDVKRTVVTGKSSSVGGVEIVSGLKDGDAVVLTQ